MAKETYEHARPAETDDVDAPPEPSHAERARTLVHLGRVGTLSTVSRRVPDFPFGSVAPYGLDESGAPTFLVSTMAMHTQNLLADDRASLLVTGPGANEDPLGSGRVTLVGRVARATEESVAKVRELYLERNPSASYWVDFKDFAFFQMAVAEIYFVGGFGVMGWVEADDYAAAAPDPLADAAPGIIEHMNADHVDAMLRLVKAHAGIDATGAQMTSVDRLGFNVKLETEDRVRGARVGFEREVRTPEETRAVLVSMVRALEDAT